MGTQSAFCFFSIGSERGHCRITDHAIECAADDDLEPRVTSWSGTQIPIRAEDQQKCPDSRLYPTVAGAVVPIYNLRGETEGELLLRPKTIARIFRGAITSWADAEIVSLNPALQSSGMLPDVPIVVCVREEESGSTELFTRLLFEAEFGRQVGASALSSWANRTVTRSSSDLGVALSVLTTSFSIGYTVLDEARSLN